MSKGEFTSVAQANGGLANMINWEGRTKSSGLRSCADRSGGGDQKVVRFYDPDGNLIEVGTPVN